MKNFPGLLETAVASQRSEGERSGIACLKEERFLNRTEIPQISIAPRMHSDHSFQNFDWKVIWLVNYSTNQILKNQIVQTLLFPTKPTARLYHLRLASYPEHARSCSVPKYTAKTSVSLDTKPLVSILTMVKSDALSRQHIFLAREHFVSWRIVKYRLSQSIRCENWL